MFLNTVMALAAVIHLSNGAGRIYKAFDSLSSYDAAQAVCDNNYGTTLATVIDRADLFWLYYAMDSAGIDSSDVHGTQMFIGLNDRDNEGVFRWIDETSCPFTGTNIDGIYTCLPPSQSDCAVNDNGDCSSFASYLPQWNSGEPSNSNNEDYGIIAFGSSYTDVSLNDGHGGSGDSRFFACNYPLNPLLANDKEYLQNIFKNEEDYQLFLNGNDELSIVGFNNKNDLVNNYESYIIGSIIVIMIISIMVYYVNKNKNKLQNEYQPLV
eukprot:CAMPEP_0201574182 /NCGR_PEP_ID=MMETSP0190_2-20130828/18492_1 /ASSEMBLY_ACC=CAM_ASM_000263 /TAXON_ID=37353 /ORGANISM="Rosalina sp." /LENGTH=266 /DNA_ID=CAMNT_0048002071 /DNA_START=87 /DNA_END=887 /DNA_ORIENTATION=-